MRIVFCGTPEFAVPSLRHLLSFSEFQIVAVLSQPDRPRGRGQTVSASPVKEAAQAAGIPVHQPEKIRSAESLELLRGLAPDAVVIIAYGQIVPANLLTIPPLGWINLHASLLPAYRGAAPIHWAIANGETRTGLTTMRIDPGMDTGEILLQQPVEIGPSETAPELSVRMAQAGAPLVAETLRGLQNGSIHTSAQDHAAATYAPILKREDGRIHWGWSAARIYNRTRGFSPWPGSFTTFRGQLCHIWGVPDSGCSTLPPGRILRSGSGAQVVCGTATLLRLDGVKLEGRNRITAAEFLNGMRVREEESFGG